MPLYGPKILPESFIWIQIHTIYQQEYINTIAYGVFLPSHIVYQNIANAFNQIIVTMLKNKFNLL